jgi:hypothetical protein
MKLKTNKTYALFEMKDDIHINTSTYKFLTLQTIED